MTVRAAEINEDSHVVYVNDDPSECGPRLTACLCTAPGSVYVGDGTVCTPLQCDQYQQ